MRSWTAHVARVLASSCGKPWTMKRHDAKQRALWIGLGTAGALAAGGLLQAVHTRRIARDPENEALETTPRRPPAERPLGRRDPPARGGVRSRGRRDGRARPRLDRGAPVLDLRDPSPRAQGFASSPTTCAGTATARRPRAVTTGSPASARISRRCSTDACRRGGAPWSPATRSARCRSPPGPSSTTSSDGSGRPRCSTPASATWSPSTCSCPCPGIAQAINRAIALPRLPRQPGAAAALLHAAELRGGPLHRVRARRLTRTGGVLRADARHLPADVRANIGIAMSEMDLHHALPRLTVPTIVIAGADDRLTPPSHARRIAEMLPQLRRLDRARARRSHDPARAPRCGDRRPR